MKLIRLEDHPRHPPSGAATQKKITVMYFAVFRELAGLDEETVCTKSITPRDLYRELKQCYPFHLSVESLRVAVNDELVEWDVRLEDQDTVAFLAPVAGG